jgi:Short C-terminal domain
MPGLIRGVARTAAVVGTAGAVNHHQQQKWAAKDQQAAQAAAYQQQQYAPPPQQYAAPPPQYAPPAPAPVEEDPTVAKINQLASLHAQGILSDEEFASAKAKALGI